MGQTPSTSPLAAIDAIGFVDFAEPVLRHAKLLVLGSLLVGTAALGLSFLVAPTFTAATSILPPQPQPSAAASAMASLGALGSVAGLNTGLRNPGDQYVALLQSATVADRLIDQFHLIDVYKVQYRFEARRSLAGNVRISLGRRDGLIFIEVDDHDPQRAADIANSFSRELTRLTNSLALTEAQRRRVFFEAQLKQTRERLSNAQLALEAGGFNAGALRAEPRAAAESYARLKAEVTAADVRLQSLRRGLADESAEVQQQLTVLRSLRAELAKLEASNTSAGNGDYVGRFREFKYQETLNDMFSRQYELARLDESREGALVQVVDVATRPEWKSRPKRAVVALSATFATFAVLLVLVVSRHLLRAAKQRPQSAQSLQRLSDAWRAR